MNKYSINYFNKKIKRGGSMMDIDKIINDVNRIGVSYDIDKHVNPMPRPREINNFNQSTIQNKNGNGLRTTVKRNGKKSYNNLKFEL